VRPRGSGVVFGQRLTTWQAAHPKTTPDPRYPRFPQEIPGRVLTLRTITISTVKVDVPEVQFFPGEINRMSLYRKTVQPGERPPFKKLALLIFADGVVCVDRASADAATSLRESKRLPPQDQDHETHSKFPISRCPCGSLRSSLHPLPLDASCLARNVSLAPDKPWASFAARQEQSRAQTN
jgi:hypothetical protein